MSSGEEHDLEVINDICNGDKEKFRWVMDRYAPVVFHIVRRFSGDEEQVQELAHEIFLKVYEKLTTFNGDSAFSSWLYILALNYCRDHARKEQRRTGNLTGLEDDMHERVSTGEPSAEQQMINEELIHALNNAIDTLKPDFSVPLVMKYREGLTYEMMSEVLNVSVSALKVRIHRARLELRKMMEQQL